MSRKVLVVDDEKLIVKGLRFSLEQDGMEVDCAYDGEEALEKAKAGEYDIILLDLMLPKMDGLEVCQQIREFSNVPIIMLTAKGEDMDKILAILTNYMSTRTDTCKHVNEIKEAKYVKKQKEKSGMCPKCGGALVLRKGKYGKFYGCSNYPKCRYTAPVK